MRIVNYFLVLFLALSFDAFSTEEFPRVEGYFDFHGFGPVHKAGLTGVGHRVAIIEQAFGYHPPGRFPEGSVRLYDATRAPEYDAGAPRRINFYGVGEATSISEKFSPHAWETVPIGKGIFSGDTSWRRPELKNDHGTQVVSLYNGRPCEGFLGGVCPDGKVDVYHFSRCKGLCFPDYRGTGLWPLLVHNAREYEGSCDEDEIKFDEEKIKNKIENNQKWFDDDTKGFSERDRALLLEHPIDDSLRTVFDHIFGHLKRGVINFSSNTFSMFVNPFDPPPSTYHPSMKVWTGNKVPDFIKDWLVDGLTKSDNVLVIAAGNLGVDLSTTHNVDYAWIRSLLEEPRLRARIVLASNMALDPSGTAMFNRRSVSHNGNTFGAIDYLRDAALAAIGTDIGFGNNIAYSGTSWPGFNPGPVIQSGTSLAAPIIAGYLSLLAQKSPDLSMEAILAMARANAIPVGDPAIYGCGVINTDILLS